MLLIRHALNMNVGRASARQVGLKADLQSRIKLAESIAIRLPEDIEVRLNSLAKRTGRSKTFYARKAIMEYLADMEDLYLAEQVVHRLERGEERTAPLEEVEARLDLAD